MKNWPVMDNNWNIIYTLEPTNLIEYKNNMIEKISNLNYLSYLDKTKITCKSLKDKSIYISADWYLFPCCWMWHIYNLENFESKQVISEILWEDWNFDKINLFKNSLFDILNGKFYKETLPNLWNCNSINNWKLKLCSRICWELDIKKAQFEESYSIWLHAPGSDNNFHP
jgi:hypothetical protein